MQGQEQQAKGWTPIEDARKGANFAVFALQVLAAPVEVFMRTRFGAKYFGVPSAVALLALPLWMTFWPGEDPQPLLIFWGLYIVMQLRARIECARMVARGDYVHTRYNGWPRLARLFRRMPERHVKIGPETVFVCVAGGLLMAVSPPLGSYLLAAGFSSGLLGSIIDAAERARSMEINDAWIEQQSLADRVREIQRDRMR
jgi:hypothetical protein